MTIYRYPEIATYREPTGKCPGCGKRTRRKRRFWQTLSPFNRDENGTVRTREQIEAAVKAEADAWEPDFTHVGCKEPTE